MSNLKIGDKTKLNEEGKQNECYEKFKDKILVVTHIARNKKEHIGYDETFEGLPLYSFEFEDGTECLNSLYGYEIEGGETL